MLQGKEIVEYFINELKEEGVTYAEPWKDPLKEKQDELRQQNLSATKSENRIRES